MHNSHVISDENAYNQVRSMLLTFGPLSSNIDIPVTIINDSVYERTEEFHGILSFPGNPVPRVILSPNATNVTILDDDGLFWWHQVLL